MDAEPSTMAPRAEQQTCESSGGAGPWLPLSSWTREALPRQRRHGLRHAEDGSDDGDSDSSSGAVLVTDVRTIAGEGSGSFGVDAAEDQNPEQTGSAAREDDVDESLADTAEIGSHVNVPERLVEDNMVAYEEEEE